MWCAGRAMCFSVECQTDRHLNYARKSGRRGKVTLDLTNPVWLICSAALTLGSGLLFGLFPALHSTRPELVSSLKDQAGQLSGARSAARFRTVLATSQIALSPALLVVAGLFTRSLFNGSRVNLGLKVDNVITFGISPALNGYTSERARQLFEREEDDLAAAEHVNDFDTPVT